MALHIDGAKTVQVAEEVQGDEFGSLLYPGDQIMSTATHEVTVDGEKSWVKYGATTAIRPGESVEHAQARLSEVVISGSLAEVASNVAAIRAFTQKHR